MHARAIFALWNEPPANWAGDLTRAEIISYGWRANPAAHVQMPLYPGGIHEINLVDDWHALVGRHQPAGQQGARVGPAPYVWGGHHHPWQRRIGRVPTLFAQLVGALLLHRNRS